MTRTLYDLLRDLETASRFDRDLDKEIGLALAGWCAENGFLVDHQGNHADHPGGTSPNFTDDLGLALALTDRLYPGRGRVLTLMPTPSGTHCSMVIVDMPLDPDAFATDPKGWGVRYAGTGATEALAACAALVARAIGTPRQ